MLKYADLPKEMKIVTDKMAFYLNYFKVRGNFSNEMRIGKEKKPFVIDWTQEMGFHLHFANSMPTKTGQRYLWKRLR